MQGDEFSIAGLEFHRKYEAVHVESFFWLVTPYKEKIPRLASVWTRVTIFIPFKGNSLEE